MAKLLTEKDFQRRHQENIELYVRRIQRLYNKLAKNAAYIAAGIRRPKTERIFSFDDYPEIEKQIEAELKAFHDEFLATLKNAITAEFALANVKNDFLVKSILSDAAAESKNAAQYFERNNEALKAFQSRKIKGLGLSDRVWKLTDSYRKEIELALDNSISTGRYSALAAKDVQRYLQHPEKLFRRVRNDRGDLVASKAMNEFKTGRGVYKSSYKNAMRLTRSETNISYQIADQKRSEQMDFVVGKKIVRSNNPYNCDICNFVSNQLYPKSFIFKQFHPQCRCSVILVLMSDGEIDKLNDYIIEGKSVDFKSINEVEKLPDSFIKWVKDNKPALLRAKQVPYFISDNNISLG